MNKPERDPQRISNILAGIRIAWEKYPSLRLGQLIVNLSGTSDPYYIEDNEMLWAIQRYVDTPQEGK